MSRLSKFYYRYLRLTAHALYSSSFIQTNIFSPFSDRGQEDIIILYNLYNNARTAAAADMRRIYAGNSAYKNRSLSPLNDYAFSLFILSSCFCLLGDSFKHLTRNTFYWASHFLRFTTTFISSFFLYLLAYVPFRNLCNVNTIIYESAGFLHIIICILPSELSAKIKRWDRELVLEQKQIPLRLFQDT